MIGRGGDRGGGVEVGVGTGRVLSDDREKNRVGERKKDGGGRVDPRYED